MTTPTGKLAWGQAGVYDASDDRAVIAAVTRYRTGLAWPAVIRAGAGLNIIVEGGWLGVASCGDRTSAVVGSALDHVVQASPGPPTGTRQDVLWCETEPEEGQWSMHVIPLPQAAARFGIPLAYINVPGGANTAADMDILPEDASLERRLLGVRYRGADYGDYQAWSWGQAEARRLETYPVRLEPGQWYRARYDCTCASVLNGSQEGRIGIGSRIEGQGPGLSLSARQAVIRWPVYGVPMPWSVEWVFRHPVDAVPVSRIFDGRLWSLGTGTIRPGGYTDVGDTQMITVEDVGS